MELVSFPPRSLHFLLNSREFWWPSYLVSGRPQVGAPQVVGALPTFPTAPRKFFSSPTPLASPTAGPTVANVSLTLPSSASSDIPLTYEALETQVPTYPPPVSATQAVTNFNPSQPVASVGPRPTLATGTLGANSAAGSADPASAGPPAGSPAPLCPSGVGLLFLIAFLG